MHYRVSGHWRLKVSEDCSSLLTLLITVVQQPGTASPPSRLKSSSTGVIWMCKASFTNNSCPLPWSSTVVSSQWIGWRCSHACSATADFSIIPLLQASRCSFSLVSSLRLVFRCRLGRSCRGYDMHWIVYHEVMYPSLWSTSNRESVRT